MVAGSPHVPPGGDAARLDIGLLGGFRVRVDGEPLDSLRSGRARSLLAFLVVHADVVHPRRRVASEFWPDSSEGQARTNLRNLLHTLRSSDPAIGAALKVTPTTLQWSPSESTVVDVEGFMSAAESAMATDPDQADHVVQRCREAVNLYGGDLLAGDHDEWITAPRDAFSDRYREVLRLLATALIDDGRAAQATPVLRELVRANPLDESAHRLRIEAHHSAGDRSGAVRAYHECVATLERELGIAPSASTTSAYAAVMDRPRGTPPVPGHVAVRNRPELMGRDREWKQLVAAWHAAGRDGPQVVLVTGEPGVGKTRLVEELGTWCARAGGIVAESRSYGAEGDLGYGVVTSWLRSPHIRPELEELSDLRRAELARLLPEVGTPAPADGGGEAERRRRLFDAVAAALTASGRPTLLVADDCHWSDRASSELIHYLVRQNTDAPLLVVLTARREELDAGHPVTALRDGLAVLDRLTELPLGPLTPDATGAVGAQVGGRSLSDAEIGALFVETDGNPLFIVETVRAGWDPGTPVGLTPRLRAVIDARFRSLSEVATTILGPVAVVGRPCSAMLLARLCGLDDRALAAGLDELWRRGILRETGTDSYDLSHGKLRDAAYENLSPALRRSLHAAAARILAEAAGSDPGFASGHVAMHFEAASRPEEAVVWFQRAAVEAQHVAAYAEAVRLLERALALVPALPADVRHGRELELLSGMPVPLGGAEGYGTTKMQDAHVRAVDVAASLGVELEPPVLRSMVMSALCRDEFDAAASAAGQLCDLAATTGDGALNMESHYLLGISAFWGAHLAEARVHFELVVDGFDPETRAAHHDRFGHDPQVVCLSRLANTLFFLGQDGDARSACEDAMALARDVGHPLSHDTVAIFSCALAVDLGDHDLLRRAAARLGDFGMDSLPFATKRQAIRGLLEVLEGDHARGITRVGAAFERCGDRNFYPGFRLMISRILVAACAHAGAGDEGLAACVGALSLGSTRLWDAEFHRVLAELLHLTNGPADEIDGQLRSADAVARDQGADGHRRRVEQTRRRLGLAPSPLPT